MIKVRYLSDLHLEFHPTHPELFSIPKQKEDSDTVLVIAGDVGSVGCLNVYDWIGEQSSRFKAVIMLMGNHEHYRGNITTTYSTLTAICDKYPKLYLLEDSSKVIDDVAFIGATMWTDFNNYNDRVMLEAQLRMNDYIFIANQGKQLTAKDIIEIHYKSVKYIFSAIKFFKEEGKKVVVVTHHAPSLKSTKKRYRGDMLNHAYVSDLEEMIAVAKPDIWIHGHNHDSFDYNVGATRVLANPRGYYPYDENPKFNPDSYFEV